MIARHTSRLTLSLLTLAVLAVLVPAAAEAKAKARKTSGTVREMGSTLGNGHTSGNRIRNVSCCSVLGIYQPRLTHTSSINDRFFQAIAYSGGR